MTGKLKDFLWKMGTLLTTRGQSMSGQQSKPCRPLAGYSSSSTTLLQGCKRSAFMLCIWNPSEVLSLDVGYAGF
jgi:hypothetical protein